MENSMTSLVLNNKEIMKILNEAEELMHLVIKIPGLPQPYASVRQGPHGWYDPKAKTKEAIQWYLRSIYSGPPTKRPVQIGFSFEFPVPKTWAKAKKKLAEKNEIEHKRKPDLDNLIKMYLDCLKKIVIYDDAQVIKFFPAPAKKFNNEPQTIITITEL